MAFAGQAVWVTGASSGISAAMARALAAQGARLTPSGRNEMAAVVAGGYARKMEEGATE